MSIIFPSGVDWGDGVTVLPSQPINTGGSGKFGSPTPTGALVVQNALGEGLDNQPLNEDPNSPTIELAEQATIKHVILGPYSTLIGIAPTLNRGVVLEDSFGNITRVLSTTVEKTRGNQARMTVIAEGVSFDPPPDTFEDVPVELGIDLIKFPRYYWALNPTSTDQGSTVVVKDTTVSYVTVKTALIRMIQSYRESPYQPSDDQTNGLIQSTIMVQLANGQVGITVTVANPHFDSTQPPIATQAWDGAMADIPSGNSQLLSLFVPYDPTNTSDGLTIAVAATREIISKLWRGEDVPYITGRQVRWTQYFFGSPYRDPGGYIQNPITVVPAFFFTPQTLQTSLPQGTFTGTNANLDTVAPLGPNDPTIYDKFASINPQSYSSDGTATGTTNISWLRKADEVFYERTWFRIIHTWIGSPVGHWDQDLYGAIQRPQVSTDFDQLIA